MGRGLPFPTVLKRKFRSFTSAEFLLVLGMGAGVGAGVGEQWGLLGSELPNGTQGAGSSHQSRRGRAGDWPGQQCGHVCLHFHSPRWLPCWANIGPLAWGSGECKCLQGSVQLARPPPSQEARDLLALHAPTPPQKKGMQDSFFFPESF